MMTAKDKLKQAVKRGDYKTALRIAKGFRIEFTPEEQRTVQIAYECMAGKESFYRSLRHIDVDKIKGEAIALMKSY